jgi:hypothetical protein
MIQSGEAPRAETGKLGQAITADVIWVGTINTIAYNRHARQLRTSDRELVSYSGGWGVSQKLVNVATKQVMISDTLQGEAPSVEATTMGSGINSSQVLQGMQNDIVSEVVSSILSHTFPITVVSIDGNTVVLSQGGKSVKVGNRYSMVLMGKEIKDPQTGESLGRVESPCCEVIIDKVANKLTYGHLENVTVSLDGIPEAGLQLREQIKAVLPKESTEDEKIKTTTKSTSVNDKKLAISRPSVKTDQSNESSVEDLKDDGKW